ncbi:PAS domain S-box-containing protein/diguanylate cyclase (GGDEF) domain-containing protein [Nitrosomonas marina]|uniref:PAS domain S-box-containing protein/diguanylate cyclase (GGDEF) domain-containing protein n=1 Tax=Nitrosomonas marina TaxID=917 RepID=A0A1I0A757_9PROT|nr:EAL domain-containing protein [Nitrosomonas marina]SES89966.1 PAS domain S-box-containing protein/diguanylate cyclase (GGDEF) domain-containing protein [Nitrosomonas marina]
MKNLPPEKISAFLIQSDPDSDGKLSIPSMDLISGMETILDQNSTYIFIKDIAGRYIFVNRAVKELFNKPLEEIIGFDDSHFFDLGVSNELMLNDRHVIEQGETIEREEKTFVKSTGKEKIYWTVKKPVRNDQNEIIGMCGISTDITDRKRTEIALCTLNKRLEFLLSSSPAVIYTCRAEPPYAATFVSNNLTQMLGYTVEEFLSTQDFWAEHIHPQDRYQVMSSLCDFSTQNKHILEYRFKHCKGHWLWMRDVVYAVTNPEGNHTELIGYFIEITDRKEKEQALVESRNLLKTVIDTAPVRIFWKDLESRFLGCNRAFAQDAGENCPEKMIGKKDSQLNWREQATRYCNDDQQVIRTGVPKLDYEEPQTTPNGDTIWVRTSKVPLRNADDEIIGVLGVYQDITKQKENEDYMAMAATIYKFCNEAIMVTDENNFIKAINPAFTRITGYEPGDVIGKNPRIFQSGRHNNSFYKKMWQKLQTEGHWQGEIWDRHKNGHVHAKWLNISVILNTDNSVYCYVGQFSDITEKKKQDELLFKQANYDLLTGLPNRNFFKDRLTREIKKSQRNDQQMSLLFLDLDRFKDINDTLGHDKGDKLLREVALRLTSCVRKTDTIARLGGDEFAIILPEIDDKSRIEAIARNIINKLSIPFKLDKKQANYYISTSIGIAIYPDDGIDMKALMKHADQAMYAAKLAGRNRFNYFTRSMQQEAYEKMVLTHDLRQALSRNELQVYYQPILDLKHGLICKAEALLRWKHPERGMISPHTFIPLAEESGLIKQIGEMVFTTTVANIKQWQNQFGYLLQVSINMSATQLTSLKKNQLTDYLIQQGMPGNCINVEITESLLLKDTPVVKKRLLEFLNDGIEVSIDDFGTGFSSLSYLKKFDIDYLKIDKSFIQQLADNTTDRALVDAIVVMAHKLDIKTIAEGVETELQRRLLVDIGCDFEQGFRYSPAVTAEEFTLLLKKQRNQAVKIQDLFG